MLARDAKELFVADPENESIVIDPEERKAIMDGRVGARAAAHGLPHMQEARAGLPERGE